MLKGISQNFRLAFGRNVETVSIKQNILNSVIDFAWVSLRFLGLACAHSRISETSVISVNTFVTR